MPVLTSTDLVTWESAGTVLPDPPPGQWYWAPEVAYDDGTFFLYASVGGPEGEGHQVRVATSTSPVGPFGALGEALDPEAAFSIDASPFRDEDGSWYLFSCRDFLEGERVGTGIVVHRLDGMTALAGPATVVVRPHAEWHVYERQRHWYDRVWDWYTVEGPFVVRHGGRLWCFYSGGAWRAENYGVTWAVADDPLGPWSPAPPAEAADVLRTAPGAVGPGHASVVVGPDNRSSYLVYHAWDEGLRGRRMCIDRLRWSDEGIPLPSGPTTGPQPAPEASAVSWVDERVLEEPVDLALPAAGPDPVVEVNVAGRGAAAYGMRIGGTLVALVPDERRLDVGRLAVALPPTFDFDAFHQLLLDPDGVVRLDGRPVGRADAGAAAEVALWVEGGSAAFAGVSVS